MGAGNGETKMTILDAIRHFRQERDMSYEQARDAAIEYFNKNGLEVPDSIMSLYMRKQKDKLVVSY